MKKTLLLAAGLCAAAVPLLSHAQFARPEAAVRYRQSVMNVMATHFGRIGAMVNGRIPFDAKAAAGNAAIVAQMSSMPFAAFGPDTNVGTHRALPEVWSDAAGFKAAQDKMQSTIPALVEAASSGDAAKLKVAFGATNGACQACHDKFQKPPQ